MKAIFCTKKKKKTERDYENQKKERWSVAVLETPSYLC